jgi:intracellular multiplication protein IcmC
MAMVDGSSMLSSVTQSLPGVETLLNASVSLAGLVLTGMAVLKFIEIGRHGDTPGGTHWMTPIMYLLAATALWNFSSSVDSMLETFFGASTSSSNLLSYNASSSTLPSQTQAMVSALIMLLRLYGYVTYARGWLTVKKIGSNQNGSDEPFKTAMIRLIAGVALINIVGTVDAISTTFGFGNVL